jgi:hypothetical protein
VGSLRSPLTPDVRLRPPQERRTRGVVVDLLFASSGIEPEIAAIAEPIEVLPGHVDDPRLDLEHSPRRDEEVSDACPEEVLDGLPVLRAFAGQGRFSLRVLEPGESAKEERVVHFLPEDAPDCRRAFGDPEPVRLERRVEIEEVAAGPPVEDRVKSRAEEPCDVEALAFDERGRRSER